MNDDLDNRKKKIQEQGLKAIEEYFNIDLSQLDNKTLKHLHQKAKIGLTFEKEMNLNKRSVELNYLRVFRLYAEDKKELRDLLKSSMSHYLPK